MLTASNGHLGRIEAAQAAFAHLAALRKGLTLGNERKPKFPERGETWVEGFRKAGVPTS